MEEKEAEWLALRDTKLWMRAVLDEARELFNLSDLQNRYFKSMPSTKEKVEDLREQSRIREYYFIIGLNKTCEWLKEAAKYEEIYQDVLDRIENETPHIREIRNMREHEIEYYSGDGRQQEDFIRSFGNGYSDATSTLVTDDDYVIGGRISVRKVQTLFEEVAPPLFERFNNFFIDNQDY